MSHLDQGLGLFEDNATAVGSFPLQMRGYAKEQVDAYIKKLESQLTDLRHQVTDSSVPAPALDSTPVQVTAPDVNQLSGHTAQILQASQAKSDEMVTNASAEANRIVSEATAAAQELRLAGRADVDALRTAALDNLAATRDAQTKELQSMLDRAKADIESTRASAKAHADSLIAAAQHDATGILDAAKREADQIKHKAEHEATTALATAQAARDSLVAEAYKAMEEGHAAKSAALAEIAARQEASASKLAEESELAASIRSTAVAEADIIRKDGTAHAQHLLEAAQNSAAAARTKLVTEAGNRRSKLQADITALQQRKRAITQQLGNLFGLGVAAASEFPDDQWGDLPEVTFETLDGTPIAAGALTGQTENEASASGDSHNLVGDVEDVVDSNDDRPENWVEETE